MQEAREISLVEVLINILKKWKLIVIFAVIFAIVLGGYKFISNYGAEISKEAEKEDILSYEDYCLQLEMNNKKMDIYSAVLDSGEEYINDSYALDIDPLNCAAASKTCIFIGGDKYAEAAVANVTAVLRSMDYAKAEVAAGTELDGLDSSHILDLISISSPANNYETASPRFTISVIAKDEKTASAICDNISKCADSEMTKNINKYGLEEPLQYFWTDTNSSIAYNKALYDSIASSQKLYSDVYTQLIGAKKAIEDLEEKYGEIYGEGYTGETEPVIETVSFAAAAKSAIKFAVIGFVLGAIIGMVIAFCKVLFRPVLYCSRQLKDEAKLKFIGNIEDNESLKGVDKLNKKLAGDKEFMSPANERVTYAAANLAALSKDKRVLITGTLSAADVQDAMEILRKADGSLQLCYKGNLTSSAAAVKALDDADAILIMEKSGVTEIKPLSALIDSCRLTDKPILGYVMI